MAKQKVSPNGEPISFPMRLGMAAFAGGCGGFLGTPGDMINVRMQNDIKLPPEQRRKYVVLISLDLMSSELISQLYIKMLR